MKTLKILSLAIFTLMIASCSKNDDTVVVVEVVELTTAQLLTSGPWFIEDVTGATMTDCYRQTTFDFTDSGYMIIEAYNMNGGSCEYSGSEVYNYTLSDMLIILESSGSENVLTIDLINESQLLFTINSGGGDQTYTFRK